MTDNSLKIRHNKPNAVLLSLPQGERASGVQTVTGHRRRSRHAGRPLPRGALSRPVVLPHPAHHPQRRGARERQARRSPRTGCRPGRRCAFRRCELDPPKPRDDAPRPTRRPRVPQVDHAVRGRRRAGAQQADGACGAGRLRHHRAMSTACSRCCATGATASARAWCTGSTRTPPAACWSPRRASPRRRSPKPSARARRARSTGRWSPACRSRSRAASRPSSPRRSARTTAFMRIAQHGEEGASHAVTYYAVVETAGAAARLGVAQAGHRPHPSAARAHGPYRPSDRRRPEIFRASENWELPGGMQNRLHLLARRIVVPHPRGGVDRRHRAAAAAHAAVLEPARPRRHALRPDRGCAGGVRRRRELRPRLPVENGGGQSLRAP